MAARRSTGPTRTVDGFALDTDIDDYFQTMMALSFYEPDTVAAVRRFAAAGSVVLDVGAHFGYLALHAGRAVGPDGSVHAFECDPRLYARLVKHVYLNDMPWIVPVASAASDRDGAATFLLADQLGWSTMRPDTHLMGLTRTTVETVTLDHYVESAGVDAEAVSLVIVDAEGAEDAVLRGARSLLASNAAFLVEMVPSRPTAAVIERIMAEQGRSAWAMRRGRLARHDPSRADDVLYLK